MKRFGCTILSMVLTAVALAGCAETAAAQDNPVKFAGEFRAVNYAYGVAPNTSALKLDMAAPSATGTATLTVAYGTVTLSDGTSLTPLATTAPITVGIGATQETITPTAVSCSTPAVYDTCTFTGSFTYQHGTGEPVTSGTYGLQEAINAAANWGPAGATGLGGTVLIDGAWYKLGGAKSNITARTSATPNVWIRDTSGLGPVWYGKSGVTTAAYSAVNNDMSFQLTEASGTATKTLSQTYAVAPNCVGSYISGTATGILKIAPTTTTVVVTDSVSEANVVQMSCALQK
jgi:hypothetical protein